MPKSPSDTQPQSSRPQPGFWSLFALSLGLSLLCTFVAVSYQRRQALKSSPRG